MLAESRRRALHDFIQQRGYATLAELKSQLNVSESTLRRDLDHLEQLGVIRRTHGGAVDVEESRVVNDPEEPPPINPDVKASIGRATADLIEDGDTVLLDGGTTTLAVARAIAGRPIQVVTNSLPIAQTLATSSPTDLILLGGYVYPRTGVALGPLAIASLKGIRVRKAILGAGGVMPEGVYNANLLLVETERAMMDQAQEVILVADSSKYGRLSLCWVCGLDALSRVVVDAGLPEDYRTLLNDHGVTIVPATEPLESSTSTNPSTRSSPSVHGASTDQSTAPPHSTNGQPVREGGSSP